MAKIKKEKEEKKEREANVELILLDLQYVGREEERRGGVREGEEEGRGGRMETKRERGDRGVGQKGGWGRDEHKQ